MDNHSREILEGNIGPVESSLEKKKEEYLNTRWVGNIHHISVSQDLQFLLVLGFVALLL